MSTIVRAENAVGDRFELNRLVGDEAAGRVVAVHVAALLSWIGCPDVWAGGKVTVHDLGSDRLLFVARIRTPVTRLPRSVTDQKESERCEGR